jgi:propanol-preferring alcohol dehydrogenase
MGLRVIVIDARDEALQLAKECGADAIIDARRGKNQVIAEVHQLTNGRGADATINVSDHETATATAVAVTKMHGTMVQIAQPESVSVPFAELVFRDVRIHESLICRLVYFYGKLTCLIIQGSRGECQKMLDVVSKHKIKVKTNPFKGLTELPKAVELAYSGKMQGKPVIIIDYEATETEKKSGLQMI